jgi:hypothetical protein
VAAKIEESRRLTASDDQFDLAPDHSTAKPNIRRLRKAVDQHPELWAFAQDPTVVDLAADLLGVLTFGVYLDDTGPAQGPLTALPATHRGSTAGTPMRRAGICSRPSETATPESLPARKTLGHRTTGPILFGEGEGRRLFPHLGIDATFDAF